MRKPALLVVLMLIFTTAQAHPPERTVLALFTLASSIYSQLVFTLNPDQTTQWVLIDDQGQETELNAVQLNQGVAIIHFNQEDTDVVSFGLHYTWQNVAQFILMTTGIFFLNNTRLSKNYPKYL